jgi:hypothetical protein
MCCISEKYVFRTAKMNPTPKINNMNNIKGIIDAKIIKWNSAPVKYITTNRIINEIKKLINS